MILSEKEQITPKPEEEVAQKEKIPQKKLKNPKHMAQEEMPQKKKANISKKKNPCPTLLDLATISIQINNE